MSAPRLRHNPQFAVLSIISVKGCLISEANDHSWAYKLLMFGNLTFAYTKPALCELYKKHPFCTKIHLFKTKLKKNFWDCTAPVGRGYPSQPPHAPSPRRLKLGVPRVLFLGNDPCSPVSEESHVWESHVSLQESTTVHSKFKLLFKCTSC